MTKDRGKGLDRLGEFATMKIKEILTTGSWLPGSTRKAESRNYLDKTIVLVPIIGTVLLLGKKLEEA